MQHFVLCTRVTVAQLVELVGCYYSGGLVVGTLGSFSPAEMSLKQTLNTKLPCVIVYGKNVLWFASKLKKKNLPNKIILMVKTWWLVARQLLYLFGQDYNFPSLVVKLLCMLFFNWLYNLRHNWPEFPFQCPCPYIFNTQHSDAL